MWQRFWAVFQARNLEFFKDRASLGWNIVFPILMVLGFAVVFDGDKRPEYKVGVMASSASEATAPLADGRKVDFLQLKHIEFVDYQDLTLAKLKLQQHALDLLVDPSARQYWVNESSPKGYFVEQLLLGSDNRYQKTALQGREIRYLDWVLPGILGMNMMFSCLFGVGYVIVRYRKSSVLKRLKATPLRAFEFVLAQISSRLFIVVALTSCIFIGCNWLFDFYMLGSYGLLLLVTFLGAMSMISLGLLVASRSRSEELTSGLLNLVSWPMMILSGVWFSLEGAPQAIQNAALLLPLTHLVDAARSIMTEGAGFWDLKQQIFSMVAMIVLFLGLGSVLFRWEGDGR